MPLQLPSRIPRASSPNNSGTRGAPIAPKPNAEDLPTRDVSGALANLVFKSPKKSKSPVKYFPPLPRAAVAAPHVAPEPLPAPPPLSPAAEAAPPMVAEPPVPAPPPSPIPAPESGRMRRTRANAAARLRMPTRSPVRAAQQRAARSRERRHAAGMARPGELPDNDPDFPLERKERLRELVYLIENIMCLLMLFVLFCYIFAPKPEKAPEIEKEKDIWDKIADYYNGTREYLGGVAYACAKFFGLPALGRLLHIID